MEPEKRIQCGQTDAAQDGVPAGMVPVCCCMVGFPAKAALAWGYVEEALEVNCWARRLRRRLRSFLPEARSSQRSWACALRVTLLGPERLVTRRWRKTEKVRRHIAWREPEVCVVKHVATVCLDPW